MAWKTVRIFISSTFRDMHAERDFLVHDVFLELKERCAKRRLQLIDVDLRWGVTEEEERQGKVLEICLDEIERCRPFFIGLLGERYGSTPPNYEVPDDEQYRWVKELEKSDNRPSVTALEIYHGVLRNPSMKTRAFFYFRDPTFLTDPRFLKEVPKEKQNDFLAESEDAAKKLKALKDEIRKQCRVFDGYSCGYGGLDEYGQVKISDLETFFGKRLLEELWDAIKLEYPEDLTPPDELEIERSYHEAFIEGRTQCFIGRPGVLEQLTTFADSENESAMVVMGKAGCGKSAVLAKFAREHSSNHPETFVLAHFIGVSPGSTDIRRTLLRLCRELARQFNIQEEIPTDYYELRQTFVKFLENATTQGKVVLLIDALNQLDETHYAHALDWLPHSLPNGLKIIVSTIDDSDCLEALSRRNSTPCEIGALTKEERKDIVRQTLEVYGKHLDEKPHNDQMRLLLSKRESDNPLYLTVACEEMRVFGEFERVTKRIEVLPNKVEALFEQVLERIEVDHENVESGKGRERVKVALSLLECSRHGLLESEMLELLARDGEEHLPQAIWARLYRGLKFYLRPSGSDAGAGDSGEGLLDFFHRQLAKAVRQRYLNDTDAEVATHKLLARYFNRKADPNDDNTWSGNYPRVLSELSHHLLSGNLYDDLFELARDESFLRTQTAAFPDDPGLQLQTLQNAITGAAEIDDAAKMAEFVIARARRVALMRSESPLDALRGGNLGRAWELTDLYTAERSVLWHLVLAWELKDDQRTEKAKLTLERLLKKNLPRLTFQEGEFASVLLCQVIGIDEHIVFGLRDILLDSNALECMCRSLASLGYLGQAHKTADKLDDLGQAARVFGEIAKIQAQSGSVTAASDTFREALECVRQIQAGASRDQFLEQVAVLQAQSNFHKEAIETAQQILDEWTRDSALEKITSTQSQQGQFETAFKTSGRMTRKDAALLEIVKGQVGAGLLVAAESTRTQLDSDVELVEAMMAIAEGQSKNGEGAGAEGTLAKAREIAKDIDFEEDRISALSTIVKSLIGLNHDEEAWEVFDDLLEACGQLEVGFPKVESLAEIAGCAAEHGRLDKAHWIIEQAIQTLRPLIDEEDAGEWDEMVGYEKPREKLSNTLYEFAEALIAGGWFTEALEWARQVNSACEGFALDHICRKQVAEHKFEDAVETANLIESPWTREYVMVETAKEQIRAGEHSKARDTIAQGIYSTKHVGTARDIGLSVISRCYAQRSRIEDAIQYSCKIESDRDRTLAQILTVPCVSIALSDARKVIAQFTFDDHKDEAIQSLIRIYATSQKIAEAESLLYLISADLEWPKAIGTIAEGQASLGDIDVARQSYQRAYDLASAQCAKSDATQLEKHQSAEQVAEIQLQIVMSQARSGQFSEAIDASRNRLYGLHQATALRDVGVLQAKAGKTDDADFTFLEAEECAGEAFNIHSVNSAFALERSAARYYFRQEAFNAFEVKRSSVQCSLAVAQAGVAADDSVEAYLEKAFDIAEASGDQDLLAQTWSLIAKTEAKRGLTLEALNRRIQILDEGLWAETLMDIAATEATGGSRDLAQEIFVDAVEIVLRIEREEARAAALYQVAATQARCGFRMQALYTAGLILTEQSRFLPDIANAFAVSEDKEGLKLMLTLCSSDSSAAYRICVELARLYPLQSIAIARIISEKLEAA